MSGYRETTDQKEQKVEAITGTLREVSVKRASWRERWLLVQGCNQPSRRDLVKRHWREINTLMSFLSASHFLVVAKDNRQAEAEEPIDRVHQSWLAGLQSGCGTWRASGGAKGSHLTQHLCLEILCCSFARGGFTSTPKGRGGGEGAWTGLLPWVVPAGGGAAQMVLFCLGLLHFLCSSSSVHKRQCCPVRRVPPVGPSL